MSATILIVDDEAPLRIALEYLMRAAGYDVTLADDGPSGLAAIKEHRPDVVLLDVEMPGCSGLELCQKVRNDPALRATRILLLSARTDEDCIQRGLSFGADGFMAKPFSTQELVGRVSGLLAEA